MKGAQTLAIEKKNMKDLVMNMEDMYHALLLHVLPLISLPLNTLSWSALPYDALP
jgi:hypothetical protein